MTLEEARKARGEAHKAYAKARAKSLEDYEKAFKALTEACKSYNKALDEAKGK